VVDDAGIYAVYLVCTHLGCTPNYVTNVTSGSGVQDNTAQARGVRKPGEQIPNGWACPCHGSRYFIDSTNFYGPAPRPMDWIDIQVTPDDHFEIDRSKLVVIRGAGDQTPPEWRLLTSTKKDNGKTLGV
jgi:cytochrome b6-f complex iron-sulfur subunit